MQKGSAIIWILVAGVLLALLFVPIPRPYYEPHDCVIALSNECSPFGPSIFERIKIKINESRIRNVKVEKLAITPTPADLSRDEVLRDWKTYRNIFFGFELKYPSSLNINSLGPNSAQEQLNQGEIISGTAQPSYDTIVFSDQNNSKLFDIGVFHPTEKSISSANYEGGYLYLSGACDLRWLDSKPSLTRTITINSLNLLEVKFTKTTYLGCYYLKNKANNLIVFNTAKLDNQTKFEEVDNILNQILSTFKFLD